MKKLMLAFAAGGALALTGCQGEGGERDLGETEAVQEETTFEGYEELDETAPAEEAGRDSAPGEGTSSGSGMGEAATSGEETAPAEEAGGGTETGESASGETATGGDPGGSEEEQPQGVGENPYGL